MMRPGGQPVIILNQNTKRENGRKVQQDNISAAKAVADVIRTTLGPRSMLKMLMDPMGGIVLTNDGNAILREITVEHPSAKLMIETSRTQDEEVGDGTTSVIILAGEILLGSQRFIDDKIHPTVIINAYRQALEDAVEILKEKISIPVDMSNENELLSILRSCLATKMTKKYGDLLPQIALEAVRTVITEEGGKKVIDFKRYARIEKVPGGAIEESRVLRGVMLNKDVLHHKMKRRIENPRILLLDCNLEYKKGESQTNIEISQDMDFTRILELEEEYIKKICDDIIRMKPDLIITEKGISDLASHYLLKAGITAMRRVKKSDNNRLARACGATIVNRPDEIKESDIGSGCGLFEVKKIGDEYWAYITECRDPKACTVLLRGPTKDLINEVERNLQDAMNSARNVLLEPRLCPGGGATEMALSQALTEKSKSVAGVMQWPYRAVAQALEIIPCTLAQNCGAQVIRVLTALRARHANGETSMGINGETGEIVNMNELKIWDPLAVKLQVFKTAVETAILLLRIDDIVSGTKKISDLDGPNQTQTAPAEPTEESMRE
ncbi:T-complex protein 1 subunit gamma-like [Artemia franciscana]|uniref:T-complex protein 1 subunit gamma-like n=2 Tax=Artemia franciscana TaxID=6661 RepID=UPI0032DB3840